MATISHIAKSSGLSRTTVAEVLRNKPGYSEQTRAKVLKFAQQLNYRPNYLSKALAGGRSMTIGLLVSSIDTPNEVETMRAIETSARDEGWLTFLLGWEEDLDETLCSHVDGLVSRRVDGIVLYRTRPLPTNARKRLDNCGVPVVYLGWVPDDALHLVRDERNTAIHQLAEHLASLGHRRVAYVHSYFDTLYPDRRLRHFQHAMAANDIELEVSERWYLPRGIEHELASYQIASKASLTNGPTAILAHNDRSARGIMTALHERGVRVPHDIAVVGFGDSPQALAGRPGLTTIRQPNTELGQEVFKLLHQLIEQPELATRRKQVVIHCELIVRGSTSPDHVDETA
ncbi:LacI family DNA-binding transcriptional regulator [Phycisphaerales bacterium AB-hyl4]|uniref:LacI family DNA-binding transcriptional regulator n=1 Tax=Natronomicrosphaera hydrolytica TaxID=3242702 RepID=A0ABV4U779_9BACT